MVDTFNALLSYAHYSPIAHEPIPLPIGISFFTFQAMSYVIDVYRHDAPAQRNPLNCLLYIALFPQLIAGPIVRYRQVAEQIVSRTVTTSGFSSGIQRLIYGLSKKVLLANPLGQVADAMFSVPAETLTTGAAWLGLVCYTFQIYYDFSGYSDMAIGLGRLFGFEFPENFNYPYASRSIREFWRRWHMTLSFWFRDYLYIPLGGSRVSTARTYANLWLVFFLCGLWHGAGWTFVLWGALHGLYLVGERAFWGAALERLWRPVQHLYTLGLVMIGWVFFRADTVSSAVHYLNRLVGLAQTQAALHDAWLHLDPKTVLTLGIGCLLAAPVAPRWSTTWAERARNAGTALPSFVLSAARGGLLAFLFVACAAHLAAGTYNPFIYFRF
jgi:alginate O-acetyltransferase complex protein AlgI